MSAPRTKRPFAGASSDPSQRQITSFFSTQSGPAPPPAGPSPNIQETIPSDVQSNLLSVGMRVRKSVPEGYKTGSYSSFKLWTDATDRRTPVVRTTTTTSNTHRNRSAASQRELLPFCGINKVGGLSSQPVHSSSDEDEDENGGGVPGLDDMPGLCSSQESVESVESTASDGRSKKRFFAHDEESDEPVQMWADRAAWLEGEVSPRSLAPSGWANARPLAVPRKSRHGVKTRLGQENVVLDDFEDAEFLVTPDTDMSDA
ncbi:ribonucleotide reductase inhibitor-domain-containing protein [Colletotrichum godetiae]|uniref:Ribonucleotide reductase inhibitor-domain-containing protein n=1 Tax=Colletotrichum godetiae TaxID=1209918 RepID=A0AAJ0F2U4_9PEZI|nr:ribonucleotide reductase inhibitor-domain-containing protein [Colletotrichum godetiae]KAK1700996.1 ribonucleotide reductase inhibitor-domain-containing protein [Colletotrichum godetiae]